MYILINAFWRKIECLIHSVRERAYFIIAVTGTIFLSAFVMGCFDDGPSSWPGGRWYPGEPQYGMAIEKNVPIVMDDGATLYANIGYPADLETGKRAEGTFPVLLTQNQYCIPGTNESIYPLNQFLVSHGYIYVVAQVRGTGYTTGPDGDTLANDMFSERQAEDGVQLVDWVAHELDGSNGVVGLDGLSFLGISQIFTAAKLGPDSPVKAMVPASAGHSYNLYFSGGIMTSLEDIAKIPPANIILGVKNFFANAKWQTWLNEQYYEGKEEAYNGDYWQKKTTSNMAEQVVASGIPALLWTGWNATEMADALELYSALQNAAAGLPPLGPMALDQPATGRYQIIVGSWIHGFGIDQTLILEWYDHWLKGQDTGIDETSTPMHLYEMKGDRWINMSHVPFTDTYTPFYIEAEGKLNRNIPGEGQDSIRWANPDEENSMLFYTSAPLEQPKTIAGTITTTVWASSSNTNMELIAVLYDVDPDGKEKEITHGALLGSLRAVSDEGSWYDTNDIMIQARHLFLSDDYLTPDKTERFDINLYPTLWKVGAGHSLRLEISTMAGSDRCNVLEVLDVAWPCVLSKSQEETLPGGVYTIFQGGTTATRINIPFVNPSSLATIYSDKTPTSSGFSMPLDWGTILE
ncbi:MAG: hypothetical protein KJ737_22740 [Proteobacteria bacterium]|nr:hypothetical protein [Pseudomonadota bacterium]